MRNSLRTILPALFCSLLVAAAVPAVAPAAAGKTQAQTQTQESRLGRGFGRRTSPSLGSRPRYRSPARRPVARRPFTARRFFRGVLQALGLAFLFNLLFGWGAGGSPFGLLLLAAIILFAFSRLRRPRYPAYRAYR